MVLAGSFEQRHFTSEGRREPPLFRGLQESERQDADLDD